DTSDEMESRSFASSNCSDILPDVVTVKKIHDETLPSSSEERTDTANISQLKALSLNFLQNISEISNEEEVPKLSPCHKCGKEILAFPLRAFVVLSCEHIFHRTCIEQHIVRIDTQASTHPSCPICSTIIEVIREEGTLASDKYQMVSKIRSLIVSEKKTFQQSPDTQVIIEDHETSPIASEIISDNQNGGASTAEKGTTNVVQVNSTSSSRHSSPRIEPSLAEKRVVKANQDEIMSWYHFAESFEKRVKEIMDGDMRLNGQQARTRVYEEVVEHLPGFTKDSLRKRTAKARNIYKLFGRTYHPTTGEEVNGIGFAKIKRIKTYSADYISKFSSKQIFNIIERVAGADRVPQVDANGSRIQVRHKLNQQLNTQAHKFNEDDLNALKVRFQPAAKDHVIPNEKIEKFPEQYVCPKINRDMLSNEGFKVQEISDFSDDAVQTFFNKLHIVTRNPPGIPESRTDNLVADLLRIARLNNYPLEIAQQLPCKLHIFNKPYVSAKPDFVVTKGTISMIAVEDKTLQNVDPRFDFGEMQIAAEILSCGDENIRKVKKVTDQ
ncbi:3414_t:CDS:2, partial [Diversispora eburnea]